MGHLVKQIEWPVGLELQLSRGCLKLNILVEHLMEYMDEIKRQMEWMNETITWNEDWQMEGW